MLNCLENYEEFEFFAEKRLIFKDPDKPAPSPKQQLADIKGDLAALRAELEEKDEDDDSPSTPAKPKKPSYHTDVHTASGDLEAPKPRYRKSSEISRKAIELKDALEPKEVMNIQNAHEGLYEQYMNPAFMNHMRQRGKAEYDKVYKALDLAIHNPFALEYVTTGTNKLKIVKKRPYKKDAIPKNFEIVMETNPINAVKISGIDLRTPSGEIAWISNKEYNKRMKDYQEQWNNEKYRYLRDKMANLPATEPDRSKAWKKLNKEALMAITEDKRDMFVLDCIHFPKRFVALVAARGAGFEFEEKDPRFQDVKKYEAIQGQTYKEVIEKNNLQLMVVPDPDPKLKGVYQIRAANGPLSVEPLRVTAEGYMMIQKPNGDWVPDPRYHEVVRRQYYKKNPKALETLTPAQKAELEALNKKIPTQAEKLEKAKKAREKREKVDAALDKAEIDTLKNIALTITPAENHADIKKLKKGEEQKLRFGIKKWLNEHPEDVDKVAAILKIKEEKEAPPKEKEKLEKVNAAVDKADMATLKKVALAVTPAENHADIKKLKKGEEQKLRFGIKKWLKEHPKDVDKAAAILKAAEAKEAAKSPKQKVIGLLDALTDPKKIKQIITDLGPDGEAAAKGVEKQKEQIKKWLKDGKISVATLLAKLAEMAQ